MIESPDYVDPVHGIPVFSLYGEVRRPTAAMMETFDVLLVDLQDVGCRIYTYITTLRYVMEAAARYEKEIWILDRPNPAGRMVEGLALRSGWESFVGSAKIPMRHGLTMGEMAMYFENKLELNIDPQVILMQGWQPDTAPGYGWPLEQRSWVNPSPNAPNISMARCFSGTVMLEGTTLSEGRGTTRPLEVFGALGLEVPVLLKKMHELAPGWLQGCRMRECWFEPTFQKYAGQLCAGVQIHVEHEHYQHKAFRPWHLIALLFKSLRMLQPDYEIWRDFPYEYELDKLPIDVINGSPLLREWVDDSAAQVGDLLALTAVDEAAWLEERSTYLLYP